MKIDRDDVEKNLPKKGFRREESRHIYFYHEFEGQETGSYTYISHSSRTRDISDGLLNAMRKQLRLDKTKDVVDLVECPLDGNELNNILIRNGVFSPTRK